MLTLIALATLPPFQTADNPLARRAPLALSVANPKDAKVNSVLEIEVSADGTYDNPFDPEGVSLDAVITAPSGVKYTIAGFLYQSYARSLVGAQETLATIGKPGWRIRVCPTEVGDYRAVVTFRDRKGVISRDLQFKALAPSAPGFVRLNKTDKRYFALENGTSFYPIGENVGWAGTQGTYDYDNWFKKLGDQKATWARLWLSPGWTTLGMERPGKPEEGKGLGMIDLASAWRLDHVLSQAELNGLWCQLCIESYNILRDRDASNYWEQTPHNRDNGGPLRIWSDFWTDPKMDRLYKNKLRYLVARYAANPRVFAWEFWNEVDLTRDYTPTVARDWHQRMTKELKSLDPYGHLISTSLSETMGDRTFDLMPELDFIQTHHYNSSDLAGTVAYQQSRKAGYGKAHFFGEIGADGAGPRGKEDPDGLQIHDPLWMSLATGASGGAMPWWWDNYVEPLNLYSIFGAAAKFVNGIDWGAEEFRQADTSLAPANPNAAPTYRDLTFEGGPTGWKNGPGMTPQRITIKEGIAQGEPVAGMLHGVRNHPELHNPVTFVTEFSRPITLSLEVGGVSGYGGAELAVTLDGSRVMTRKFDTPDDAVEGTETQKYAGRYPITVPAGKHTVTVSNEGKDWMYISYRFEKATKRNGPPLRAWAITGSTKAIAWIRLDGRSWRNIAQLKQKPLPAAPSVLGLDGLASGPWKVEVWDTWAGTVLTSQILRVPAQGRIRIPLPSIDRDVAVRLDFQGVSIGK